MYAHRLAAHIKICNVATKNARMRQEKFYCLDCNSGPPLDFVKTLTLPTAGMEAEPGIGADQTNTEPIDAELLLLKVRCAYRKYVEPELLETEAEKALGEDVLTILKRATLTFTGIIAQTMDSVPSVEEVINQDSDVDTEEGAEENSVEGNIAQSGDSKAAAMGGPTSFRKQRHLEQELQICTQMQKFGLLDTSNTNSGISYQELPMGSLSTVASEAMYVELGAGRGGLGYAVHLSAPSSRLVLVERCGVGKKKDRALRQQEKSGKFARVRMDIRHCLLSGLPGFDELLRKCAHSPSEDRTSDDSDKFYLPRSGIIIIAKHLCGVATDLALNSLRDPALGLGPPDKAAGNAVNSTEHSTRKKVPVGVAVASCCHHCCNWQDYSGRHWLESLKFSQNELGTEADSNIYTGIRAAEFAALTHWSGWATGLAGEWSGRRGSKAEPLLPVSGRNGDNGVELANAPTSYEKAPAAFSGQVASSLVNAQTGVKGPSRHSKSSSFIDSHVPRPANLSPKDMAEAGFMAKRLLDHGRVVYLRSLQMRAAQVRFCSPRLTPECYLILASSQPDERTT